jgi:hypothetical protein
VIADLLTPLDVAGMMLTFDALHTTRKTARLITGPLDAHYMPILRGNQPLTLQAAQALLSGTYTEFVDSMDVDGDRGHRRTERRTLRVAPCDDTVFPGARQVLRLRRDTGGLDGVRTGKESSTASSAYRRPSQSRAPRPLCERPLDRSGPPTSDSKRDPSRRRLPAQDG